MAKDHFHLAWFLSQDYGPKAWRSMWPGTETDKHCWMMPHIFVDRAKGLERGIFLATAVNAAPSADADGAGLRKPQRFGSVAF